MAALTKDQFIICLDTHTTGTTETWVRIDKSTIFSLDPAPQTESKDYICYENAIEETTGYKPSLPQEIVLDSSNAIYQFIFNKFYNLPTGSDLTVPMLMCFATVDSTNKAWYVPNATITLGSLETTSNKLSFTCNLGGTINKGTWTHTGTDANTGYSFVAADAA